MKKLKAESRLTRADKIVQHEASGWVALQAARDLTLKERADFADWIARSPRHAAIFAEVHACWTGLGQLASVPHSQDTLPDPDLLAPSRSSLSWRPLTMSLAAAAALVFGAFWFKPWTALRDNTSSFSTAEQSSHFLQRLPDNSIVELNSDALVRELFTATERRIHLVRGEAQFFVTKDPTRAFVVEANGVAIRAVGTAFNVRLDTKTVEVLVTEGTVHVAPVALVAEKNERLGPTERALAQGDMSATLVVGQRTVVSVSDEVELRKPVVETLTPADIDRALSWSRFAFDDTPLPEVVARLNQQSVDQTGRTYLTIRDPRLATLRISGRIRYDKIESFVEVLESSFGIIAERGRDGEISLRQSDPH